MNEPSSYGLKYKCTANKLYSDFIQSLSQIQGSAIPEEVEEIDKIQKVYRTSKSNIENLIHQDIACKESLVSTKAKIAVLEDHIANLKKEIGEERKFIKKAQVAVETVTLYYSKYLNMSLRTESNEDDLIVVDLSFKENEKYLIKFTIDKKKRHIIKFRPCFQLNPDLIEFLERNIRIGNYPKIVCKLREVVCNNS